MFETNPAPLGPGCQRTQTSQNKQLTAVILTPIAAGGVNASETNLSDNMACAPNNNYTQFNNTKNERSTYVNNDTIIMSKNTLKAISESTNQMIVNSISSMKSSSSQTAKINQKIEIVIKGVGGDVTVSDVSNKAEINMVNLAEISLDAFDNVKTDLADSILNEFKTNTNNESISTMDANLQTNIANDTKAIVDIKRATEIDQKKNSNLVGADPNPIPNNNTDANVNITQNTNLDNKDSYESSNKFIRDTNTERIMETHIKNAVTQNFTKESISQLSQYLEQNQNIKITIEDVGGNVLVNNIENATNVVLRQTLANKMNVGNAICNAAKKSMGIITDDTDISKNFQDSGLTNTTDLRNGLTSDVQMKSELKYKQTITQDTGLGSSTSSLACSFLPCIICIVCVLSFGVGGLTAAAAASGIASSESPTDKLQPGEEIDNSDSSNSTNSTESSDGMPNSSESLESIDSPGTSVGGYYYFD